MTNIIWFVLLPFSLGELATYSIQLRVLLVGLAILYIVLYHDRLKPHIRELVFCLFSFVMGVVL